MIVASILTSALAGCRGDVQQCEQACRNFGNLVDWKAAEVEIAAAPADRRDALRQQRADELEPRIRFCVAQCVSANDRDSIACLIAAKTADQARACTK